MNKTDIPKEFYKCNLETPSAETVEELIKQLGRLPKDLQIRQGFGVGCVLNVFNVSSSSSCAPMHLNIDEAE